jgi:hypothetical protein
MFVVFDLDGTLALTGHREHHLRKTPKDWDAFFADCVDDTPCLPLVAAANLFTMSGHRTAIWTGRSCAVAHQTVAWMSQHGLHVSEMIMRLENDHRPDTELKGEWLAAEATPPDLVFEDRASVVDWWRSKGIVCAQVAPGRF